MTALEIFIEILKKPHNNKNHKNIINISEFSQQIILRGSPGTGKTRLAKIMAVKIIDEDMTNSEGQEDSVYLECYKNKKIGDKDFSDQVKLIQFHPAYMYEDFVIGMDISTNDGEVEYKVKAKGIKAFADKAIEDKEKKFVLIIDEINRAPLSSVMGELLYALEYRGNKGEVHIPYNETLIIPDNLFIIGTMNTADHSITELDYALRRRFAFVDVNPEIINTHNDSEFKFAKELFKYINTLFVDENISYGIRPIDVKLGTSYYIYKDKEHLKYKIEYEISPMLKEYYKDGVFRKRGKIKLEEEKDEYIFSELTHSGRNVD